MEESKKKEIIQENNQEYSIYNYLKSTPSILIALISAFVAFITFIARVASMNMMKTALSFWKFDLSYINYNNTSLWFSALALFLYSLMSGLILLWYQRCEKSMIPSKKVIYICKYLIKNVGIKAKKTHNSDEENQYNDHIVKVKSVMKKMKSEHRKFTLLSIIPTLVLISFINFLYLSATSKLSGFKYWIFLLIIIVFHMAYLKLLSIIFNNKELSKRKIKDICESDSFEKIDRILNQVNETDHPLMVLFSDGIRSFFDNIALILCILLIVLNSISVCTSSFISTKKDTWKSDVYRIVNLEEKNYVILLQDGDQYYLERAEIVTKEENVEESELSELNTVTDEVQEEIKDENKEKSILYIYLDEQRVIASDDISYTQYKFDDIVKVESGDVKK